MVAPRQLRTVADGIERCTRSAAPSLERADVGVGPIAEIAEAVVVGRLSTSEVGIQGVGREPVGPPDGPGQFVCGGRPGARVRSFWFCAATDAAIRTFCADVAKWLCHNNVSFSYSGCPTLIMRRSQHCSSSSFCSARWCRCCLRAFVIAAAVGIGIGVQRGVDIGRPILSGYRVDPGAV